MMDDIEHRIRTFQACEAPAVKILIIEGQAMITAISPECHAMITVCHAMITACHTMITVMFTVCHAMIVLCPL